MAGAALAVAWAVAGCAAVTAENRTGSTAFDGNRSVPLRGAQAAPTIVRRRRFTFIDHRRIVHFRDGHRSVRRLITFVRYPVGAGAGKGPAHPLIVFAHGFALMPRDYRSLLYAWARAGFVVAAPVLPGENEAAAGGPNRADLINEPADIRFVIARLLKESRRHESPLRGMIDPARIAVAGHSDGGDAALSVAYDARFRSRRIGAAMVLAGADMPGIAAFRFPVHGPPLLAVQGGADAINPPTATEAFYGRAPSPKLLLTFPGAGHYGPYLTQRPQLRILERVSIAFLARALGSAPPDWRQIKRLGHVRGVARITGRLR